MAVIQWDPSNPDTLGNIPSNVYVNGVILRKFPDIVSFSSLGSGLVTAPDTVQAPSNNNSMVTSGLLLKPDYLQLSSKE